MILKLHILVTAAAACCRSFVIHLHLWIFCWCNHLLILFSAFKSLLWCVGAVFLIRSFKKSSQKKKSVKKRSTLVPEHLFQTSSIHSGKVQVKLGAWTRSVQKAQGYSVDTTTTPWQPSSRARHRAFFFSFPFTIKCCEIHQWNRKMSSLTYDFNSSQDT